MLCLTIVVLRNSTCQYALWEYNLLKHIVAHVSWLRWQYLTGYRYVTTLSRFIFTPIPMIVFDYQSSIMLWTVVEGGLLSLLCENVIFQFCLTFRNKMSCTNIPPNQNKVCKHKAFEWLLCICKDGEDDQFISEQMFEIFYIYIYI